jgi:hypothetical protein
MVINRLGNKSSMQPMKDLTWSHKGSNFFFFVKGGGGVDFFFPLFPPCSL